MAKHKAYKTKNRRIKERNLRRQDTFIDNLKYNHGRPLVSLLTETEKKNFSSYIIGHTDCPFCKKNVQVINDGSLQGQPRFDYLVNHVPPGARTRLCEGSEKNLYDFKK